MKSMQNSKEKGPYSGTLQEEKELEKKTVCFDRRRSRWHGYQQNLKKFQDEDRGYWCATER